MAVTWLLAFKNFKNDCVPLVFLQVFYLSCFNLGGSIEPPEPPLDSPQNPKGRALSEESRDMNLNKWAALFFVKTFNTFLRIGIFNLIRTTLNGNLTRAKLVAFLW